MENRTQKKVKHERSIQAFQHFSCEKRNPKLIAENVQNRNDLIYTLMESNRKFTDDLHFDNPIPHNFCGVTNFAVQREICNEILHSV